LTEANATMFQNIKRKFNTIMQLLWAYLKFAHQVGWCPKQLDT